MSGLRKYEWFADGIVVVHFLWTIIVFGGAVLMFFWHRYALDEIIVVSFTLLISLPFGGLCPLTMMEERFRRKLDPSFKNGGSYIAYYINKVLGAGFSVRTVNTVIGVFYGFVYAAAVYIMVRG